MRSKIITKTLAAAVVNNICASQSLLAAGNLLINGSSAVGGVATLDTQRRVLITSAGNDSGMTFTVFGTNQDGAKIQETIVGGNIAAVATSQDFFTVTQISGSAATASTVQVGTNGVGSSQWALLDSHVTPTNIGLGVLVSGTVNFTVEYTYDDILNLSVGQVPTIFSLAALASKSSNTDSPSNQLTARALRLTINSNTPPGSATLTAIQAGIRQ